MKKLKAKIIISNTKEKESHAGAIQAITSVCLHDANTFVEGYLGKFNTIYMILTEAQLGRLVYQISALSAPFCIDSIERVEEQPSNIFDISKYSNN